MAKKYFTFYGFNESTQKVERLVRGDCEALFLSQDNRKEDINISDVAKDYLKAGKATVYFKMQKRQEDKFGFCTLVPNVTPKNKNVKDNMNKFAFGYDMDIEKAREIFETAEQETEDNNMTSERATSDVELFDIADEWLNVKREIAKIKPEVDAIQAMFDSFEDGEVVTDGNSYFTVVTGTDYSYYKVDSKLLEEAGLKDKYTKLGSSSVTIKVNDGTKIPSERSPIYDKDAFSPIELTEKLNWYNKYAPKLDELSKQLENYRDILKGCVNDGDTKVKSGSRELIITKTTSKPRAMIDEDKVKADGLFDKYSKLIEPKFVSVRKLS